MLRKVRLYGKLAKFLGRRVLEADVSSAAEAVRFLLANWPALEQHMATQHYRVQVGECSITAEELHDPAGTQSIKITPVIAGSGAVGRIIAGVALIGLSFIPGIGALGVSLILGTGSSLVLGGVAQLLTPVPKLPTGSDSPTDPRKNYSFSSIQNVSRQGTPVPIVYGEMLVGSVVVSVGLDVDQVLA